MKIISKYKPVIKRILFAYCIYVIVTGVVLFLFHSRDTIPYNKNNTIDRFLGNEVGQDRIGLLEEEYESGVARLDIIEKAEETVDIAYYTTQNGLSRDIFFGSVIEAADRGVKVRILIDGIVHNLIGSARDIKYMLKNHPNVELKFYEPLNLVKPWTWNNRLHDKHIIVDNKYAITGGRNIGDKYYLKNSTSNIVKDRDVLIFNTNPNKDNTVIKEIKTYFDKLWNHEFSKEAVKHLNNYKAKKGKEKEEYLKKLIEELKQSEENEIYKDIDWYNKSVPTNKITFIHNPIKRFNKDPWVLQEIAGIMENGENEIFIQSPYVILIEDMIKYLDVDKIKEKEISVLTNSLATSPNYLAIAAYSNNRTDIVGNIDNLYEYHGTGSIHGKSIIIDDEISLVGSFNMDPRSAFLNTESMVVVNSKEFTQLLQQEVDNIIGDSLLVKEDYTYEETSHKEEKKVSKIKNIIIKVLQFFVRFFKHLI